MEFRVSPIFEHQSITSATGAAEWTKEVQESKAQADQVGGKPRTDKWVGVIFLAIAVEAIQPLFLAALAGFPAVRFVRIVETSWSWRRKNVFNVHFSNCVFCLCHQSKLNEFNGSVKSEMAHVPIVFPLTHLGKLFSPGN